jgi:hypothetical protein
MNSLAVVIVVPIVCVGGTLARTTVLGAQWVRGHFRGFPDNCMGQYHGRREGLARRRGPGGEHYMPGLSAGMSGDGSSWTERSSLAIRMART